MNISKYKWALWTYIKTKKNAALYRSRKNKLKGKEFLSVLHYDIENWGDWVNRPLVEALSGKPAVSVDIDFKYAQKNQTQFDEGQVLYMVIGSIVAHADSQTVIWGAGLQNAGISLKEHPKKVCAVRGPLTREQLIWQGIHCDEVYGDPVLLMPRFYNPKVEKKYKIGVIAHRSDADNKYIRDFCEAHEDIKFINMRSRSMSTVDEILECEAILSTSLHGLIVADAYGIPSAWGRASEKIPGGYFKYRDYYQSIGEHDKTEPDLYINKPIERANLEPLLTLKKMDIDLDLLQKSCPFLGEGRP